jgi:hypothetical protein
MQVTSSKGARPMSDPKVEYHFSPPAPATVVTMTGEAYDHAVAKAKRAGRAEEREACAKIADDLGADAKALNRDRSSNDWSDYSTAALIIAQRIRARGNANG